VVGPGLEWVPALVLEPALGQVPVPARAQALERELARARVPGLALVWARSRWQRARSPARLLLPGLESVFSFSLFSSNKILGNHQ